MTVVYECGDYGRVRFFFLVDLRFGCAGRGSVVARNGHAFASDCTVLSILFRFRSILDAICARLLFI